MYVYKLTTEGWQPT